MGLHPNEIGRFFYPDFSRYIDFYTDPKRFMDGYFNQEDAEQKLTTYHDIQQDLIRKAEAKKQQEKVE